ncbi:hypothetical protein MYAM1_000883 [Malassezia yamatoensis]|uniref:Nucleoporin Nup54 alpha-helical domain-containing protein n=1 Tax=Malassezia yamatoensis TaxID=253288 RepID=A0AAJ6CFW0_9BASI|nr:hypothetical protein MYAM1_000883 [Malassezia yamatoensis]
MAFSFGKPTASSTASNSAGNSGLLGSSQPSNQPWQPGQSNFSFGSGGTSGLFGAKQPESGPSTSMFGQTAPSTQPTQATQSSGMFGQNTPAQANNPSNTSLFGQSTTNTQYGQKNNLFGQTAASSAQQPQSTSLFGQAPQTQQQNQSGLFGQSANQSKQQTQPGSLFGQPSTQPMSSSTSNLFGQPNTTNTQSSSFFGQNKSQTGPSSSSQPGMFSSQGPAQSQSGLFGQSSGATASMGASPAPSSAPNVFDARLGAPLNTQLEQIRASWDTSNLASCQFQQYLYNRASDVQALQQLTQRRPDAVGPMHDALWTKAMQENPDPERLYPVLAVGFSDLRSRVQAQESEAARQHAKLAELAKQIDALQQKHDLSNTIRAQTAMLTQSRIHQRLLSLVKDCPHLLPALRSQGLTTSDDQLLATFENCEVQLNGTNNGISGSAPEQMLLRAQINELWAQIGVVRAKREALASQGRVDSGNTEWTVVDEASFEELTSILASLQQGLLHLINTLSSDSRALNMVCEGLTGVPLIGIRNR